MGARPPGPGPSPHPPATRSTTGPPRRGARPRAAERSPGRRRGVGRWPFLGPAFIAAVAYVDPGNFATNMAAGAKFGYLLLWVVLTANLMAMLIQSMSAKLGIATRQEPPRGLPRAVLAPYARRALAPGRGRSRWRPTSPSSSAPRSALNLLFGIALFPAALITGVAALRDPRAAGARVPAARGGDRRAHRRHRRRLRVPGLRRRPEPSEVASGFVPGFDGTESVLLAVGIIGATVMPHVIYLHSALTQHRIVGATEEEKRRIYRFELVDVVIAMSDRRAHQHEHADHRRVDVLRPGPHRRRRRPHAGLRRARRVPRARTRTSCSACALLASGLSSSSVGTMAGQVVMQGFIGRQIPLFVRRVDHDAPGLRGHRGRHRPVRARSCSARSCSRSGSRSR